MWFLFCVVLWFLLQVFRVVSCLNLCNRGFQSCLAMLSPRLGMRKLVKAVLMHLFLFLFFARVSFSPFSFPLGVSD